MRAEGVRIDAVTVQNEPLHPGNNPSLLMLAEQQADFVKNHLGPAFEAAKLDTKIIIYDHNADRPDYPLTILRDPAARRYVDGSAFHLYAGPIEALTQVHDAYPGQERVLHRAVGGLEERLRRKPALARAHPADRGHPQLGPHRAGMEPGRRPAGRTRTRPAAAPSAAAPSPSTATP